MGGHGTSVLVLVFVDYSVEEAGHYLYRRRALVLHPLESGN